MRTVCNRGGGGVKKSGKIAYVINGRPQTEFILNILVTTGNT